MIWVALAEAVSLIVILATGARLLSSMQHAHARREDLLINQLLHATGKAWSPAPATAERRQRDDTEVLRFTPSPEQLPD